MLATLNGLRKWSVAMGALLCAFVLALLGKLTGDFVTITGITVAAFHAGNTFEAKYKANGNGNATEPSTGTGTT